MATANPYIGQQNGNYSGNHSYGQGNQTNLGFGGGQPNLQPTSVSRPPNQMYTSQVPPAGLPGGMYGQQRPYQPQSMYGQQHPYQPQNQGYGGQNSSGGYGPSANTLQNQSTLPVLQAGIQGQTPEQKAAYYNSLISQGYNDSQIRTAAGPQSNSDWSSLQTLAGGMPQQSMTNDQLMLARAQQQQNVSLAAMYAPYNQAPVVAAPTGNTLSYAQEQANALPSGLLGGKGRI